ncbi:MAG TPA: FtsX-like permease family protein [Deferrisomatales bacterium]|nr:FtsX-like permease family protein [Deferrisomatales bacterium]
MRVWFERQRSILDLALSSLWRRRGKNLVLLLVYTAVVFLLASVVLFSNALKREARLLLAGSPDLIVQKLVAGRYDLIPAAHADKLAGIPGVARVSGRLWGYHYDPVTGANYTLMVQEENPPPAGGVFVGNGVARLRGEGKGGRLSLRSYDGEHLHFRVEGVFAAESELISADLVLLAREDFLRLYGVPPGLVTDLSVGVPNPREIDTVAAKIQAVLPDSRVISRDEILRTYDAAFDWRGGIILLVLSVCLFAFAILAWDRASGLSAEEKREIGILKAVGWETSDVLLLKFWEGSAISLTAFLGGTVLAWTQVFLLGAPLFDAVLKGWSTLYPEFRPAPLVAPELFAVLFFLSVAPYAVASIIPAWRAATIDPDEVMR